MSLNEVWKKQKDIGKVGEDWFAEYFSNLDYLVIDCSNDQFLGIESGIDFICEGVRTGKIMKWDVKTDTRISETGNMFVEIFDDATNNSLGWFYKGKVDGICYVDVNQEILYLFTKDALRQYLEENNVSERRVTDYCYRCTKVRVGKLVNISKFEKWCIENKKKFMKEYRVLPKEELEDDFL